MINKKVLKKISTILMICLSMLMITSPSIAAQRVNYDSLFEEGIFYKENFEDSQGNNIRLTIEKKGDELKAKTFVNDVLMDSAKRKILPDGSLDKYIYHSKNGSKEIHKINVNNLIKSNSASYVKETSNDLPSIQSDSPSYPYITSEYSSAYGYRGYLYGEETSNTTENESFYFDTGTALTTISLALAGFWVNQGFSVTMLLVSLGVQVYQDSILSPAVGEIVQERSRWDYEVFVEDTLSLVAYITDITTKVYDERDRLKEVFYDKETGGPYENRSDIIHHGIYVYAVIMS